MVDKRTLVLIVVLFFSFTLVSSISWSGGGGSTVAINPFDQVLNTTSNVNFQNLTVEGNATSGWFNGKFNWIINLLDASSAYLSFNGTTLSFDESKLNSTIQDQSLNNTEANSLYLNLSGTNANQDINITPFNLIASNFSVQDTILFNGGNHILRINASQEFGGISGEAFWLDHSEDPGEGRITFLVSSIKPNSDIDGINIMAQIGLNNSAGLLGNSWMVLPNNLTNNLTTYSNCFLIWEDILGRQLRVACDTGDTGADFLVDDDIQLGGTLFADSGIRAETIANFIMHGEDLEVSNGSIHNLIPVSFVSGFMAGEEVVVMNELFTAGLGRFSNIQSDLGNWFTTSDIFCDQGDCAASVGISGDGNIIMEANISTLGINATRLQFVYSIISLSGSNDFEVTVNNNEGSGEVSLFTDSGSDTLNLQDLALPSSMDNRANIGIRFICDATQPFRECFVDDIRLNGTAQVDSNITVQGFDSEFCGAEGTRDVNGDCNVGIRWDAEQAQWIISGTLNATGTIIGGISGSGTATQIPKFASTTSLTNSLMSDNSTDIINTGGFFATQFNGLFNWTSISDYLTFNGGSLDFNESLLNNTIDSRSSLVDNLTVTNNLTVENVALIENFITKGVGFIFNFRGAGNSAVLNFTSARFGIQSQDGNTTLRLFGDPDNFDHQVLRIANTENVDDAENKLFVVSHSGFGIGSLFTRSLQVGGVDGFCNNLTSLVACNTTNGGADFLVENDIWNGGDAFFANGSVNISSGSIIAGDITIKDNVISSNTGTVSFNNDDLRTLGTGNYLGLFGGILRLQRDDSSINSGNNLGHLFFAGADPVEDTLGASIRGLATEEWNSSQNGAEIEFRTTEPLSTTELTRLTIESDGTADFVDNLIITEGDLKANNGNFTGDLFVQDDLFVFDQVGIGTASPTHLLNVDGTINITGSSIFQNSITATETNFFTDAGGFPLNLIRGSDQFQFMITGNNFGIRSNSNKAFFIQNVTLGAEPIFYADTGSRRVGIGTNAPDVMFHVDVEDDRNPPALSADTVALFANMQGTFNDSEITIMSGTNGHSILNFGDYGNEDAAYIDYGQGTKIMTFHTETDFNFDGGPVGIGRTAPDVGSALDVNGDILENGNDVAVIKTGSYTGDGTTSQAITGIGFLPVKVEIVNIVNDGVSVSEFWTNPTLMANDPQGGAIRTQLGANIFLDNAIISLDADGFTVDDAGGNLHPNLNGATYTYIAFGD